MDKTTLRKKYRTLRESLTNEQIADWSLKIANKALELPIWDHQYYHIFLPIKNKQEVDTEYLLHILQGKDKSVVIPVAQFETGEMLHILLQENTLLKTSAYGIPEPVSGIEVQPAQIEVVFIPLLAFDLKGNRIGYGKGFYDRFLSKCGPNTRLVGLSFFPPESSFEIHQNDIPLHYCITPEKIHFFK